MRGKYLVPLRYQATTRHIKPSCIAPILHVTSSTARLVNPPHHNRNQKKKTRLSSPFFVRSLQSDTGANTNATPILANLRKVRWIQPTTISSAEQGAKMEIKAVGTYDLICDNVAIPITMYYCPNLTNTIVSPTAVAEQYSTDYMGYHMLANLDDNKGSIQLISREGSYAQSAVQWTISSMNGLWYHGNHSHTTLAAPLQISSLSSKAGKYELWHQRLAHCGTWVLENIHKHVIGIPKLQGNPFYKCPSCMTAKLATKRASNKIQPLGTEAVYEECNRTTTDEADPTKQTTTNSILPGQHFHMDFGFVSSQEFQSTTEQGKNVTSIDGKRAYLLIVD